jgi:hypothetical protein
MNVYKALRRYIENKPANLSPKLAKMAMYAIVFRYITDNVDDDTKIKITEHIDMLLEEFFV